MVPSEEQHSKEDQQKTPDKNKEQQKPQRVFSIWRSVFWFLILYLIVSQVVSMLQETQRVDLSYTEFKQQVRTDNVQQVTFKDTKIYGEFKNEYEKVIEADNETLTYTRFSSVKPNIEDPALMQLLEKHTVTVNAIAGNGFDWMYLLIMWLPWILLIGYFVYAGNKFRSQMRGAGGGGGLFGIGKSKARKYRQSMVNMGFDDVAGLENAKKNLAEIIDFMIKPEKFSKLGADIPNGVLLLGPPGCGKTLLAKAVAGEANTPFYNISGSEFIEMFVGVGASRVRDLFNNAKKSAPSIIFIDEIDSIGRVRGTGLGGGHDEREQTLNQILSEMDGFEPHQAVVVIAATNRPDVLDPALTRPGRFDRQIILEMPRKEAREKILKIHTRNVPLADDVDFSNLSARCAGFSGADLKNLVNEAALLAGREDQDTVHMKDFELARDKIMLGMERDENVDKDERERIAYHESGHALAAYYLPHTDPLQKVTILARGQALGATEQLPEKERHNLKKNYLLSLVAVRLGGRQAEQLIFNDISSGSHADLKQATRLVRKMVCQWGMSERIGPVTYQVGEEHVFLGKEMSRQKDFSEHTARIIDEEVHSILGQKEKEVSALLRDHKDQLNKLAHELIENETLEKEEIERILSS